MKGYLWASGVAWKDYAAHVAQVRSACQRGFAGIGGSGRLSVRYLNNGKLSKEELTRSIARENGITSGPICRFDCRRARP